MTIIQVYQRYRIMPNLQTHMLRVAGVAQLIAEQLVAAGEPIESNNVIDACLLHDIGNIIKFNLTTFPQFVEPEGLEYWQQVQSDYLDKYGPGEHQASMLIAEEVGASPRVVELVESVSFSHTRETYESGDMEKMLCEYADCRVKPTGVVSLEERLTDLRQRYAHHYPSKKDEARRQEFEKHARLMEEKLFAKIDLQPTDITNATVEATFKERATRPLFS